jgi:hypothetical protein
MQMRIFAFIVISLLFHSGGSCCSTLPDPCRKMESIDTIKKGRYTLFFIDKSDDLDPLIRQRMIDAFFKVYPAQAKMYNRKTKKEVTFIMDSSYTGVAATSGGVVRYNPQWFKKHPEDIDVVTHEAMHIVQDYRGKTGPGWITEGIADYVRYKLGVNNKAANWKLPDYSAKQDFTNSYRITARFFVWIEKSYNKKFVKKLDKAMREKTYTDDFATSLTGKSFEELWQAYSANPAI